MTDQAYCLDADLAEEKIAGEQLFAGKVLRLERDEVRLPNGGQAVREVIRHLGAVCVLPIFENGDVLVEEQYRYPHARVLLEVPAGKLDRADEDPLEAVKRELREETGYSAAVLHPLGLYIPSPAILDEKVHLYIATGLVGGATELDEDEFLRVRRIPLSELCELVLAGRVPDGKTQCLALRAAELIRRGLLAY